jgi:hypothetical protein
MSDWQEGTFTLTDEVARPESADLTPQVTNDQNHEQNGLLPDVGVTPPAQPEVVPSETAHSEPADGVAETEPERWRARAGRKGAHRVHQLIQEGKLYEQEHGLKRGRQRLRQLIELGKLYEQEHGLRPPGQKKLAERQSRMGREELVGTLLQCLLRIAKPSFRPELERLVEALQKEEKHAETEPAA